MPPLKIIGLLGDVHGNAPGLARAMAWFETCAVDAVMCVGDIVDGPADGTGDVAGCIDILRSSGVRCVAGNHERMFFEDYDDVIPGETRRGDLGADEIEFLAALPRIRSFETVAGPALLCHGLGWDDFAFVDPDTRIDEVAAEEGLRWTLARGFTLCLCGHTHRRMVRCFDRVTVINAGAVGSDRSPECFALVDFARGEVRYQFVDPRQPAERVRLRDVPIEPFFFAATN
mgnify:FL=1